MTDNDIRNSYRGGFTYIKYDECFDISCKNKSEHQHNMFQCHNCMTCQLRNFNTGSNDNARI